MSNLWAALLATDKGSYPFGEDETFPVNALSEDRFDRLAGKFPFGLVAQDDGRICESGVVWATLKGNKALEKCRGFYRPPTVLFTKGANGTALWAVRPSKIGKVWDANERLARLFKGKVADGDPGAFRLDIRGHRSEWRTDAYYDLGELVSRL